MSTVKFTGSGYFRQRIICATLAGRPVRIDEIRSTEERPGLTESEASFLRLMDKLTNGTIIDINPTGTTVRYKPGIITGGPGLEHECGTARGIGYFLEALVCLAPFAKKQISITLRGITNSEKDISVDIFRTVTLRLLKHFGIEEEVELKIVKRGAPPLGGGEVFFTCPLVRQLRPVQLMDPGRIKRIRGIAYSTRISPQMANRMVDPARALLNNLLPDVYIYTDHFRGAESGLSPGYALSLVAETTTGSLMSAESTAEPGVLPEDVGLMAAKLLCEEVEKGGFVDTVNQWLVILFMALSPEDVSKVRIGKLSEYSVNLLRAIQQFFGVTFKLTPDHETKSVILSCLGSGYKNIAKKVT